MYTQINFKTKKAFKEAVTKGAHITLFTAGLGTPKQDGTEYVSGPHYPAPHTWYAQVEMKAGKVIKVK